MSNDASQGIPARSGAARFASWGVGIVLLGFGGKMLLAHRDDDPKSILALAHSRGYQPVPTTPPVGTPIYQWDPELPQFDFHMIGPVVKPVVVSGQQSEALVQQTRRRRLSIIIIPGEMRYWVRN